MTLIDAARRLPHQPEQRAQPLYEAYYQPIGYGWEDVEETIRLAKRRGLYTALNVLTFRASPIRSRSGEAVRAGLARAGRSGAGASLAIDPDQYLAARNATPRAARASACPGARAPEAGAQGAGHRNFARALGERDRALPDIAVAMRRIALGQPVKDGLIACRHGGCSDFTAWTIDASPAVVVALFLVATPAFSYDRADAVLVVTDDGALDAPTVRAIRNVAVGELRKRGIAILGRFAARTGSAGR